MNSEKPSRRNDIDGHRSYHSVNLIFETKKDGTKTLTSA